MKRPPRVGSALLPLLLLAACTQTQPETVDLAVTATIGPRLGTPVTGNYARGEALMDLTFNKDSGVGPIFNESGCKWCHAAGGLGGPGSNTGRLVHRIAAIKVGDDGVVGVDDLREADGYHELVELGGPLLHRRSLGELDRLPSQTQVMGLLGDDYRLIRSSRMGSMVAGSGLLSAIPDEQIEAYEDRQNEFYADTLGISGRVANLSGFIGRLGWKAQVTDTMNFIAGATFNEVGLAHGRNMKENVPNSGPVTVTKADLSDRQFMDLLAFNNFTAPPRPESGSRAGKAAFEKVGCQACHAAGVYTTGTGASVPEIPTDGLYSGDRDLYGRETALHGRAVDAYSDLLLHSMGGFLADGFAQGDAEGDEWRTAPLWGLRYKGAYLHDGRTQDLHTAIRMHAGRDGSDATSEAYRVVQNYLGSSGGVDGMKLSASEREELLKFLKTL
jgi:CxxC motif-containing protein (DUF1111 family)